MKDAFIYAYIFPLLFNLTFFTACSGQDKSREKVQLSKEPPTFTISPPDPQIAEYIRHIFQDNNGHLWFGTNGYGIAYYDGDSVSYFSNAQGFDGQQITGITEDAEKNLWFATDQGVVKYNWYGNPVIRKRFTNYSDQQYFEGQRFWSIFADSKGSIWAGSVSGIFRFDGVNWAPFELPYPEEVTGEFITDGTCMSMIEDKVGNMWFATMGFGAFKYDGSTFTQYTEKDGLTNNSVDHIMEDSNGNIWFGTRHMNLYTYTMDNSLTIKVKSKVSVLGQYKRFMKIKKVDSGLAAAADFIDMMVNPFLMLQKMDLLRKILTSTSS